MTRVLVALTFVLVVKYFVDGAPVAISFIFQDNLKKCLDAAQDYDYKIDKPNTVSTVECIDERDIPIQVRRFHKGQL